jgi:glycosyltransferase involved in cell wall biosynthesis
VPPRFSYLLMCYTYPPVLGGSEVEAQRVSAELQKRGHRVKVICRGGAPMPEATDWVDPFGISVRLYGGRWNEPFRSVVYALGVAWTLYRERRNYQIAYFLMQGLHLVPGLPMAHLLGKRIVMKFSGSSLVRQMADSFAGRVEIRFLRQWAARILVLNPGMTEEAREVGFDLARVGWMPNPVETEEFRPATRKQRVEIRRELGLEPDMPVVVFTGRLAPEKKLHWLVGAFALVVRAHPRAKLALVGDGSLRAEIGELVRRLDLEDHVIFTGRLGADGVLKWLQAGDVFALVSEIEGLPCSLIEAMATGMASVVSDIAANVQLIDHEVHGLLTELGNEQAIADGLLRVLDDEALRIRLGENARRRTMEQYSTQRVIDCYETLFGSLLDLPVT